MEPRELRAAAARIRMLVLDVKDAFAAVASQGSSTGAEPPLLRLVRHKAADPGATDASAEALLGQIMRTELCGDTGQTYAALFEAADRRIRVAFAGELGYAERAALLRLGTGALLSVEAGEDPIGEAVQRLVAAMHRAA